MIMKTKLILVVAIVFAIANTAKSQSAVYFCSQTNQWGYYFGGGNEK